MELLDEVLKAFLVGGEREEGAPAGVAVLGGECLVLLEDRDQVLLGERREAYILRFHCGVDCKRKCEKTSEQLKNV